MSSKIEMYDQKRKKFRGSYVLGDIAFLIAFIARSALKITGSDTGTRWTVLHGVLVLALKLAGVLGVTVEELFQIREG